jgi:hypothetical protein
MTTTLTSTDKKIIAEYELGLHQNGLEYLTMCGNPGLSQLVKYLNKDKYEEFDLWLREYNHNEYIECPWTGKKIYEPTQQLINRFQNYNKYGYDNGDNGKKFNIGIVSAGNKQNTNMDSNLDTTPDIKIESDIPNIKIEPDDNDESKKDTKKRIRIKKTIKKEMIPILESKVSILESDLVEVLAKIIDKSTSIYTSEESDEVLEPNESVKELIYPVIKFESPIEPKDYKLIDIEKITELPTKYPENFMAFCKENELKPFGLKSNNGKALATMLAYPHTYWNRKTCDQFVKKFNIPTTDSIQLFNKHSQWGILTIVDLKKPVYTFNFLTVYQTNIK